ncbi:MAG: NADP oxidoreductase [Nitrosomonadales bacterium]|jgi:[NiFe] hydrogenase diaphorase moiety large subunit|nr:MAG: NADP oxidoreductase [Nitrosomonadales bacterium]
MDSCEFSQIEQQLSPVFEQHGYEAQKLLQILLDVQEIYSFIPDEAITYIANLLSVSRVSVKAVVDFYSFLSFKSVGEYRVLFSDNITDQMLGKNELMQYFCKKMWLEPGKVSEDNLLSVDSTSCTGMCDQGPAALVNGWPLTNLDQQRLDLIAKLIRDRNPVSTWPAMLFEVKDNIYRSEILLGKPSVAGAAIKATLERGVAATLSEIEASKLRGRGGAGYSTANKWSSCRTSPGTAHYIVCNADEGEPGTFKDRVLLNSYADLVLEGMTIAAKIIGATQGFLYLRGEYRYLRRKLEEVLAQRRTAGLLGRSILGELGFDFDIEIHLGAGAYICGEESALIESLEGKSGRPRNRPPFPVTHGYLDQPTVVDNVETFACVSKIAEYDSAWFTALGTAQSSGSKILSISGDCARPGIYEYPFGVALYEIFDDCGAEDVHAVQVSGPSGTLVSCKEFRRRICFEDLPTAGALIIFNRERDILQVALNSAHFFAYESCGFCTPCRVGTQLQKKIIDKISDGYGTAYDLEELKYIGHIMRTMSHCGLGHTAANQVIDMLDKFPDAYKNKLKKLVFEPAFDLDRALEKARKITGRDDKLAHFP